MITNLEMTTMTYVHTSLKESISIDEALEKAVRPDSDLSEFHRTKLYICTLLDPRFNHYNWWSTRQYVQTFKSSATAEVDVEEDDVERTVEGGDSSPGAPEDEDPFEKQMSLSYESQVRVSTVQGMVNHRLSINWRSG